ncbi:helix-turn-helix domain-containing protein [Leptolyngbya sp. NIES-2104]|uniref:helix-turn-helix domain-containing protein n=1 Tax=Leptolyngbya sp. NIES-2104 TaxID=1552121 RepID=UPI0006EC4762|nr:RodZ domain-containing protein [Leptolyngbya sp. NIES-2104]GAP95671.1 transcriptional regulator [Leptolyngbya sp. NIES-2104]
MNKQTLQTNREQAERLAELGNRLRDRRQSQDISLEKVAGATCIQPRLLKAIEQGKIEELPEPVYIHSFIRQYADAIGLNGVEFASEFPTTGVMALPTIRTSWRSLPGAQLRPMHLYLMYMVLIFGAVNGLSYFLNRSTQASLPAIEVQQPIVPSPMGPMQPVQQPASTKKITPAPASNKPIRVGVTVAEESWVRVMADNQVAFEGELPKGTQRTWTADRQVVVRAGNAGGVIVSYNESQAKPLGQPGEIEEMIFPPDPQMATLPNENLR